MNRARIRWITLRTLLAALILAAWAVYRCVPVAADQPKPTNRPYSEAVAPFVAKYCIACHGPTKQQGSLSLQNPKSVGDDRAVWETIAQKLVNGEMPPPKKPQPSADEKKSVLAWIQTELAGTTCTGPVDPGRVTLRRLNRAEYNNAIRDLLGIDFHPADDFPSDDVGYGFDNIGDVLALSPLLMEKYLSAAEKIVDKAFAVQFPPLPPIEPYRPISFKGTVKSEGFKNRAREFSDGELYINHKFPTDGEYIIRYRGFGQQVGDKENVKVALKVDDKEVQRAEARPGAMDRTPPFKEYTAKYMAGTHKVAVTILNPLTVGKDKDKKERLYQFWGLEIQGPSVEAERLRTEAYKRIMVATPGAGLSKQECGRRIVETLARKAFRRPVNGDEVARFTKLIDLAEGQGDSFEKGVQLAVQAILVSPNFLFKVERDKKLADKPYAISEHELATRLSFFLWSSTPDDELLRLADRGELRKELEPQIRRMLKDPKVHALGENFAGQWLQIRNLKTFNPDPKLFPAFDESLRNAMMQETTLFFEAIVKEDRPILEFLDADFTFLNGRLARHYGISGVSGEEFRRVSLKGTARAGVLTQAAVLTVTSNPTRTSPVKRGKFIMENMLDAPLPPPPPDVPDLDEDKAAITSGSLRQRMEKHRTKAECAVCHNRMDALGFAFENFDAIGGWRTMDGKFKIDPSGTLPDGRSFKDPAELRQVLRGNHEQFRKCVADKLLTYALGRGVEIADRCAVDKICQTVLERNDKFSELVLAVVLSEPFQMRTPSTRGSLK